MSNNIRHVIGTLIVLAMWAVACAPAGPKAFTKDQTGTTQTVIVGEPFTVALEGNRTTGYQWSLDRPLPPTLSQPVAPTYQANSPAFGASGVETWTFVVKEPGTFTFRMKYSRPFEAERPPLTFFELTVEAK